MKKIAVFLLAAAVTGCGGDGSSSSGYGGIEKAVQFTLNPTAGPACTNADDFDRFTGRTFTSVDCTWLCATYKGQRRRYVSLDFQRDNKPGAVWHLDNEYISTGICRD